MAALPTAASAAAAIGGSSESLFSEPLPSSIPTTPSVHIPHHFTDASRASDSDYAAHIAVDWAKVLHDAKAGGGNDAKYVAKLLEQVVPTLTESMAELLKVMEREEKAEAEYNRMAQKNPNFKPRAPFLPLHWLASYLMRHNPRHESPLPTTAAYAGTVASVLKDPSNRTRTVF